MKKLTALLCIGLLAIVLTSGKDKHVKIFLIGDSTMADKTPIEGNPERGWGMVLPSYFNENVEIENHARNGRSTRTFINEGRWDFVLNRISKGDYVVIQFGHNDEVKEKKSYTTPEDFKANFERMVNDVRSKGANPILCTSVARRKFDSISGNLLDTHPVYPAIIRSVAIEMHVPLIDMQLKSEKVLKTYGSENSTKLFMHIAPGVWTAVPSGRKDDTHFVEAGAMEMAKCFVEGVKELDIKLLEKNLLKFEDVKLKLTTPVFGIDDIKPLKK
jgi:lysophospholipase L1-like esterase